MSSPALWIIAPPPTVPLCFSLRHQMKRNEWLQTNKKSSDSIFFFFTFLFTYYVFISLFLSFVISTTMLRVKTLLLKDLPQIEEHLKLMILLCCCFFLPLGPRRLGDQFCGWHHYIYNVKVLNTPMELNFEFVFWHRRVFLVHSFKCVSSVIRSL